MSNLTILQSIAGPIHSDTPCDRTGSLIRIYPAVGGGGLWDLSSSEVRIGRGYDCDVQLDDEAASRQHAVIQQDEEGCLLIDQNSTNGTYVNNKLIKQHRLLAGDRLRIGTHVLKYLSSDHIEHQYHEAVFRMTTRDGLTEAYNRQYMQEFLERELLRSAERGRSVSVAMLDVDLFKQINDNYGHLAGDEVLRELCERISCVLRGGDLFGRYGGEEFCIVFCEADAEEAAAQAETVREVVGNLPFTTKANEIPVTVSVGVATWDGGGELSVDALLKAADEGLYEAKQSWSQQSLLHSDLARLRIVFQADRLSIRASAFCAVTLVVAFDVGFRNATSTIGGDKTPRACGCLTVVT